jgi:hypothetical protein
MSERLLTERSWTGAPSRERPGEDAAQIDQRITRNEEDAGKGLPEPVIDTLFLERDALIQARSGTRP